MARQTVCRDPRIPVSRRLHRRSGDDFRDVEQRPAAYVYNRYLAIILGRRASV